MLREALEGAGGVAYLIEQARENPGPFMALIGKLIPHEVQATITSKTWEQMVAEASGSSQP